MINNNKCVRIMSSTFLSLVNDQAHLNWSKLFSYCLSINLLVTDLLHNPSGLHFVNNLRQMENRDSRICNFQKKLESKAIMAGRGSSGQNKSIPYTYECCAAQHYEHKWWNRELTLKCKLTVNCGRVDLIRRSWVRFPLRSKEYFLYLVSFPDSLDQG